MSYVIRKEGYEHRGYKLGQSVMYDDDKTEHVIIGFSEDGADCFIAITSSGGDRIKTSTYVSAVLDGREDDRYVWRRPVYLSVVKTDLSDEQLPQEISKIHALEILEDVLNSDNNGCAPHYEYSVSQMVIMRRCIEILKSK